MELKNKKQYLFDIIQNVPDTLIDEVIDFIDYLKHKDLKNNNRLDISLFSQAKLSEDWLTKEEEKAWQNL